MACANCLIGGRKNSMADGRIERLRNNSITVAKSEYLRLKVIFKDFYLPIMKQVESGGSVLVLKHDGELKFVNVPQEEKPE